MLYVGSPVAGRTHQLDRFPDPVFAGGLLGPGVAVLPPPGEQCAVAPVSGTLAKLHPHAFVVLTDSGHGVLVHLGLDTVRMQGDGFRLHVSESDAVSAGDEMITWDPSYVERAGFSPVCAVVVLDCDPHAVVHEPVDADVVPGQLLLTVTS